MRPTFLDSAVRTAALCLISLAAYGQNVTGKWQTEPNRAQFLDNVLVRAVILDLQIGADNKISGTVTEVGNGDPVKITDGTITGNKFTFKTTRERSGTATAVTWNGEIKDDDTLSVIRIAPRRPVGVAPGGGGGFAGGAPVDPIRTTREDPPPIVFHRAK